MSPEKKQFDAVVFAIGTKDTDIPIRKELVRTVQATEPVNPGLLNDAEKVLRGGVVGCETAYCSNTA